MQEVQERAGWIDECSLRGAGSAPAATPGTAASNLRCCEATWVRKIGGTVTDPVLTHLLWILTAVIKTTVVSMAASCGPEYGLTFACRFVCRMRRYSSSGARG